LAAVATAFIAAALTACAAPVDPSLPKAGPLNPQADVPPAVYRSSLADPAQRAADKPLDWRQANEEVARIGGWRAYAREANAPASAPASSPTGAEK
jgi:hypothetical protein